MEKLAFSRGSLVRNAQPLRKLLRGRARNLLAQRGRNAVEQLARLADPLVLPLHQPRPPLRGPEVPAVLPRLAAAGPAQAPPRPPAHVGPQPRLLPVRSSVLAVGHIHPGQAFHERPGLQQPVAGFSMTHISGSKCAMISRSLSTSASPSRRWRGRVVSARLYSVQTELAQTMSKCPGNASSGCRRGLSAQISTRCPGRRPPSPPPRRPCPPTWCRRKAPGVSAFLKSKITATAMKTRTFIGPDFFSAR